MLFNKSERKINLTNKSLTRYVIKGKTKGSSTSEVSPVITASFEGSKDWCGIHDRIAFKYVTGPTTLMEEPHSHDFEEFLIFLGNKPGEPKVFNAEIEISLGEEGETHTINTASIVCIPPGLVHGPVKVKSVAQSILFAVIYLSPEYTKKPASIKSSSQSGQGKEKYSKYILREPKGEPRPLDTEEWGVGFSEKIIGSDMKFGCNFHFLSILGSHMLPDPPHNHECDEFLFLIPASYENWPELGGEMELALGDDWGKLTISTAAIICLPKHLKHCPAYMKSVDKPFYWGHLLPVPYYVSSEYSGEAL